MLHARYENPFYKRYTLYELTCTIHSYANFSFWYFAMFIFYITFQSLRCIFDIRESTFYERSSGKCEYNQHLGKMFLASIQGFCFDHSWDLFFIRPFNILCFVCDWLYAPFLQHFTKFWCLMRKKGWNVSDQSKVGIVPGWSAASIEYGICTETTLCPAPLPLSLSLSLECIDGIHFFLPLSFNFAFNFISILWSQIDLHWADTTPFFLLFTKKFHLDWFDIWWIWWKNCESCHMSYGIHFNAMHKSIVWPFKKCMPSKDIFIF